jgi:5-hydroxyisourate hydrolase
MITTHVLDTSVGRPAAGVALRLEALAEDGSVTLLSHEATDADGRCRTLIPEGRAAAAGVYRLTFETGAYFEGQGVTAFFPAVSILFRVTDASQHHHVPLLLSPYGYSTYRGS